MLPLNLLISSFGSFTGMSSASLPREVKFCTGGIVWFPFQIPGSRDIQIFVLSSYTLYFLCQR